MRIIIFADKFNQDSEAAVSRESQLQQKWKRVHENIRELIDNAFGLMMNEGDEQIEDTNGRINRYRRHSSGASPSRTSSVARLQTEMAV